MKKICAILLAAVMLVSLTVAFAAGEITGLDPGTSTADVNVAVNGTAAAEVIYVDVTWKPLNFTYTTGGSTWKPATHEYEYAAGGWAAETIEEALKVVNHSNTALKAKLTFSELSDTTKGVTLTGADADAKDLATAVGTAVAVAPSLTWNIGVAGTPTIDTTAADPSYNLTAVATVTISK